MAKLTRRDFLFGVAVTGTTLALNRWLRPSTQTGRAWSSLLTIPANRVVHVHCDEATDWDYATGWYGDYVSQSNIDQMTDRGLMDLTGTATRANAWWAILPAYTAGQKVAIKINLNNASCGDDHQVIDALPQPINSVENDYCPKSGEIGGQEEYGNFHL